MKFVTVRIHFLSDAFGLLSSRNFATMATWLNDFSSLWINVMKAIETEYYCVFWKLVSLTVFQSSFLWVFITFDLMFGKRICLTPSSGFHKWFLLFQITTILLKSKEIRQTYTQKKKHAWLVFKKWTRKPRHSHFKTYLKKKKIFSPLVLYNIAWVRVSKLF